jgi:NAD(P)-dependent dehydrogenase (short-subunit alcohol dehydrogenase family)
VTKQTTSGTGRLDGKVAFLAGATGGIGRTAAEQFAREGARVVVGGRREREGQEVADAITAEGGEAIYAHLDVTDEGSVERAVQTAVSAFGRLDVMVSNAGGSSAADGPVTTASVEEFWQKTKVDLFGTFLCSRFAIPEIVKAGGGSVINMARLVRCAVVGPARRR